MTRVPVLTDPVGPARARALRRAVLAYRSETGRRSGSTVLHVGDPVGVSVRHDVRRGAALDAGLRAEVVAALLLRSRLQTPRSVVGTWDEGLVWLARPGDLDWQDADADWLLAARTAYAEAGLPLTFVVVTRDGWADPRGGATRRWKRLRERQTPAR